MNASPKVLIRSNKPLNTVSSGKAKNFLVTSSPKPTFANYTISSLTFVEYGTVEWGGFELGNTSGATSIEKPMVRYYVEVPKLV